MRKTVQLAATGILLLALAACSGGSGGGDSPPPTQPANGSISGSAN